MKPSEDSIESHCKQKSANKASLSHPPGHGEVTSFLSSMVDGSGVIIVNPVEE